MQNLLFTTITDSGISHDIEFPLHPETTSAESVSDLATRLLETISKCVYESDELKHGDILQALSMVSAVRSRMIEISPDISEAIFVDLFKQNHAAVLAAKQSMASRA